MLNGVAPLLIFNFMPDLSDAAAAKFKDIAGIPVLGDIIPHGIPIPLYLDEKLSGIYIESESKAIDIETVPQVRFDGKPPSVDQRGLNNLITVNMVASRTSVVLAVILAMNDMIFARVVKKNYTVTYLNGSTTIFNALLHGFSTSETRDDDLVRIVLQITKANLAPPGKGGTSLENKAITGATRGPAPT